MNEQKKPPETPASGAHRGDSGPATETGSPLQPRGPESARDEEPGGGEVPEQAVYCIRCGTAMSSRDRFCHACGWKAGAEPPPPPATPRVDPNASEHNRLTTLLLCILLGFLGVHRFYVGKAATGILWLCTLGLFFVGAVYDLVLIATGEFRDSDGKRIVRWD